MRDPFNWFLGIMLAFFIGLMVYIIGDEVTASCIGHEEGVVIELEYVAPWVETHVSVDEKGRTSVWLESHSAEHNVVWRTPRGLTYEADQGPFSYNGWKYGDKRQFGIWRGGWSSRLSLRPD